MTLRSFLKRNCLPFYCILYGKRRDTWKKTRYFCSILIGALCAWLICKFIFASLIIPNSLKNIILVPLIVFVAIGYAITDAIKCIILTIFVSMMGKSGRSFFRALSFAFIISGPISNLSTNLGEIVRSYSCSKVLAINLTRTRFDLMTMPFRKTLVRMKDDIKEVQDTFNEFKSVTKDLHEEVMGDDLYVNDLDEEDISNLHTSMLMRDNPSYNADLVRLNVEDFDYHSFTLAMQEVELDSKIKLIDCPGIVFSNSGSNQNMPAVLKNAQRVGDVKDPFTVAESVLKRASKEYFCKLYDITEYETFEEFFAKKAARMGKFLKKGVPDVVAAARSVLNDWNTGKIKYCTHPPEVIENNDVHVSASIVHAEAREFDVDNFEAMETDILNNFNVKNDEVMEITSTGPVEYKAPNDDENDEEEQHTIIDETEMHSKGKKRKIDEDNKKIKSDPTMELEGNQTLNKNIKDQLKKKKKQNARNEKKVSKIADVLDNFSLSASNDDKYDFDKDYVIE